MRRVVVFLLIMTCFTLSTLAVPRTATAAVAAGCDKGTFLLLPRWYKYLNIGPKVSVDKNNKQVGTPDPCAIIGPEDTKGQADPKIVQLDTAKVGGLIGLAVVDILLRIGGLVAVGYVIYGGFKYILSQGEPDNTRKARGTILASLIGLVIVMLSSAAVNFVGKVIIK